MQAIPYETEYAQWWQNLADYVDGGKRRRLKNCRCFHISAPHTSLCSCDCFVGWVSSGNCCSPPVGAIALFELSTDAAALLRAH